MSLLAGCPFTDHGSPLEEVHGPESDALRDLLEGTLLVHTTTDEFEVRDLGS